MEEQSQTQIESEAGGTGQAAQQGPTAEEIASWKVSHDTIAAIEQQLQADPATTFRQIGQRMGIDVDRLFTKKEQEQIRDAAWSEGADEDGDEWVQKRDVRKMVEEGVRSGVTEALKTALPASLNEANAAKQNTRTRVAQIYENYKSQLRTTDKNFASYEADLDQAIRSAGDEWLDFLQTRDGLDHMKNKVFVEAFQKGKITGDIANNPPPALSPTGVTGSTTEADIELSDFHKAMAKGSRMSEAEYKKYILTVEKEDRARIERILA